jgi:hypothetical protein
MQGLVNKSNGRVMRTQHTIDAAGFAIAGPTKSSYRTACHGRSACSLSWLCPRVPRPPAPCRPSSPDLDGLLRLLDCPRRIRRRKNRQSTHPTRKTPCPTGKSQPSLDNLGRLGDEGFSASGLRKDSGMPATVIAKGSTLLGLLYLLCLKLAVSWQKQA